MILAIKLRIGDAISILSYTSLKIGITYLKIQMRHRYKKRILIDGKYLSDNKGVNKLNYQRLKQREDVI